MTGKTNLIAKRLHRHDITEILLKVALNTKYLPTTRLESKIALKSSGESKLIDVKQYRQDFS